jgi:GTPase
MEGGGKEKGSTIRISVTGADDSGKTTLCGVLREGPGISDDGNGSIRKKMFNFAHEKENGLTTSIRNDLIGFD